MKTAAAKFAENGVRVNAIAPSIIEHRSPHKLATMNLGIVPTRKRALSDDGQRPAKWLVQ